MRYKMVKKSYVSYTSTYIGGCNTDIEPNQIFFSCAILFDLILKQFNSPGMFYMQSSTLFHLAWPIFRFKLEPYLEV